MKTGTFEVMEQNEMMAVNGGARSKSARRAAVKAARNNFTRNEVKRTGHMLVGYVAILSGVGGVAAASIGAAGALTANVSAAGIVTGVADVCSALK